jgi:putative transposase
VPALSVSPAWFYKWRDGDPSAQHARREQLKVEVARLFAKHRGTYGSPRITADLHDEGWSVSENTVAALMRELGLAARRKRRRKSTTRQGRGRGRAEDLIGRKFAADGVNRKWYGDGTEIPTEEGKLHLDSVLDMGSRRIAGFGLGEHHDADLATGALQIAVAVRGGKEAIFGVIMHTAYPPRTIRPQGTRAAEAARDRVDQQTRGQGGHGPVVSSRTCLRNVDSSG